MRRGDIWEEQGKWRRDERWRETQEEHDGEKGKREIRKQRRGLEWSEGVLERRGGGGTNASARVQERIKETERERWE